MSEEVLQVESVDVEVTQTTVTTVTTSSRGTGNLRSKGITRDEYDTLEYYYKYACAAYHIICPRPNGQKFVSKFLDLITGTQGLIARDDSRKEIVVALRGSTSPLDFFIDAQVLLVPLKFVGVEAAGDIRVHFGFSLAWNSVAEEVIQTVREQLAKYPSYSIVTTGHSLGGALSLLAAVSLQCNFDHKVVRTYSYGAPRVGNAEFAKFVRKLFGTRAHRVVHTNDGVPTIIPTALGYRHHGVEYWLSPEPCSHENMTKFTEENGEDPTGSGSRMSMGINLAHTMYFGILAGTPFCF